MNKCQGTIIRRIPLTESSMIVTWCTKDHGLLKTVAKGASRPKSQFSGKLDLLYEAEFEIIRSKKTDLHNLKEPITSISEICKIPKIRSEILKLVQKKPEEEK